MSMKISFTKQRFPAYLISTVVVASFSILTVLLFYLFTYQPETTVTIGQIEAVEELPVTGESDYRVFVSSAQYNGNLGSINGADNKCEQLAAAAGMEGIWHAWVSTDLADAKDRVQDAPYFLVDATTQVASGKADLVDGSISHPINKDENGNTVSGDVWTGTGSGGTVTSQHCSSWTSSSDSVMGSTGDAIEADANWTEKTTGSEEACNLEYRIYCFEYHKDRDGDGYYEDQDCDDENAEIHPNATERCNNTDDDCDGDTDEGLTRPCGTDIGACTRGTQTCSAGDWGECVGEITPTTESCDNIDNDCDGAKDEDLSRTCGSSVGICTKGSEICSNGQWGNCSGVQPATETCDGLDNDCDGKTDEGCSCETGTTQSCGSNTGACSVGTQWCGEGGQWGDCSGNIGPGAEICDEIDNDCDGTVDENLQRSCGSDVGACKKGTQICTNGDWAECSGGIEPVEEICDEKDNNCDGTVDEGCSCDTGDVRDCGSDIGECEKGTQVCEDGFWSDCRNAITPEDEICDEKDNDCDGEADEDYVCEEEAAQQDPADAADRDDSGPMATGLFTDSLPIIIPVAVLGTVALSAGGVILYLFRKSRRQKALEKFKEGQTSVQRSSQIPQSPLG